MPAQLSTTPRVVEALRRDEERFQRRKMQSQDFEYDTDANQTPRRASLKMQARLWAISRVQHRIQPTKVKTEHALAKARHRFDISLDALDKAERDFISTVLRSESLMSVTSNIFRCMQETVFADADTGRMTILEVVSDAIHNVKLCTSRFCYEENIRPLAEELKLIQKHHNELKEKFNECRAAYLREITELRNAIRPRHDPELELKYACEVKQFYDPTRYSLDPQELSFVYNVISEKMKMIFEVNPNVRHQCDVTKLTEITDRIRADEVRELKEALRRKTQEMDKWKQYLVDLGKGGLVPEGDVSCKTMGAASQQAMWTKLEILQADLWKSQSKLRDDAKEIEALRQERADLQTAYEEELAERVVVQSRLQKLEENTVVSEQKIEETVCVETKLAAAEKDVVSLRSQVRRLIKVIGAVQMWHKTAPPELMPDIDFLQDPVMIDLEREDEKRPSIFSNSPAVGNEPEPDAEPLTNCRGQRKRQGSPLSPHSLDVQATSPKKDCAKEGAEPASPARQTDAGAKDQLLVQEILGMLGDAEACATDAQQNFSDLQAEHDMLKADYARLKRVLREQSVASVIQAAEEAAEETAHKNALSEFWADGVIQNERLPLSIAALKSEHTTADILTKGISQLEAHYCRTNAALQKKQAQLREILLPYSNSKMALTDISNVQRVDELRSEIRKGRYETDQIEAQLEVARFKYTVRQAHLQQLKAMHGDQDGQNHRDAVPVSSLQLRLGEHCLALSKQLQKSVSRNSQIVEAFNDIQNQASVAADKLQQLPSEAGQSETIESDTQPLAALQRSVQKIAEIGYKGVFEHFSQKQDNGTSRSYELRRRVQEEVLSILFPVSESNRSKEQVEPSNEREDVYEVTSPTEAAKHGGDHEDVNKGHVPKTARKSIPASERGKQKGRKVHAKDKDEPTSVEDASCQTMEDTSIPAYWNVPKEQCDAAVQTDSFVFSTRQPFNSESEQVAGRSSWPSEGHREFGGTSIRRPATADGHRESCVSHKGSLSGGLIEPPLLLPPPSSSGHDEIALCNTPPLDWSVVQSSRSTDDLEQDIKHSTRPTTVTQKVGKSLPGLASKMPAVENDTTSLCSFQPTHVACHHIDPTDTLPSVLRTSAQAPQSPKLVKKQPRSADGMPNIKSTKSEERPPSADLVSAADAPHMAELPPLRTTPKAGRIRRGSASPPPSRSNAGDDNFQAIASDGLAIGGRSVGSLSRPSSGGSSAPAQTQDKYCTE